MASNEKDFILTCDRMNGSAGTMYRFPLEPNEQILKKGIASLHIDREALSGALYLTNVRIVFVGYVFGVTNQQQKAVSLKQIREIKGGKSLFMLPNVLYIAHDNDEPLKFIVQGRDEWMAAIRTQMAVAGNVKLPGTP